MDEQDDGGTWAAAAETHTASVFFAGDQAFKLKKPLDFGFADFRTRVARQRACHEEVRLNRRLSPDVYLGVADIVVAGQVIDHLVVMRRMPDERRLATMVRERRLDLTTAVRDLARLLADFHSTARIDASSGSPGRPDAVAALWAEEIEQYERACAALGHPGDAGAVRALVTAYVGGRRPLFDSRVDAGLVRDGHGDLLADDIFILDDGPRVLDCLEFDERLRFGDVWLDVAFLAMDLERLGAADLATQFLAAYAEFSGSGAPDSLRHFYIAYRAHIRAKVAAIRAAQGDPAAARRIDPLIRLCTEHLEAGAVTLVLVGGLPGAGKTTLAGALADRLGAAQLSSDVLRKQLSGLPDSRSAAAPYRTGIYSPRTTARTYMEMLTRARTALGLGEPVVLDASWHCAEQREHARRLAADTSSVLVEVCCAVDDATAARRLGGRSTGPSDADPAVRTLMAAEFDPWPEAAVVDTTGPAVDAVLGEVRRAVRRRTAAGG